MSAQTKIVEWMRRHPEQVWWRATDFMRAELGDFFVGYEASARISELVKARPQQIAVRFVGRFREIALNY